MTDDSQTSTRHFIRGGQVLLHNYRMIKQLFDRILIFVFIILIGVTIGVASYRLHGFHIFAAKHWFAAQVFTFFDKDATQKMVLPHEFDNGVDVKIVSSAQVLHDYRIKQAIEEIREVIMISMIYGIVTSMVSLVLVFIYLKRRGRKQSEEKRLRGYEIVSAKDINNLIKKIGVSDIQIGGIPLPKDFECGHVLIHGTTGMGKSVCIKEFLDQIRKRGDRAIIYDQGCDYIGSFYNKDDIILNPLDKRTSSWHLWNECRYSADYDSLAAALIPTPGENDDQFWNNAARVAFSATAKKLQSDATRSMQKLLRILLTNDLATMEKFLRGTEAAPLFSQRIDRTTLSIRAVLAAYLRGLKYIKDEDNPFSIREWIQDDNKKNWLFISSRADSHETLKPLISMWLDLSANALMSLTPSHTRRIWLIFDELASLHKLPYLPSAFAQSRKFGGCIIAGMQSIAQLRKIYSQNAADEISAMCNTRIFFRSPSNEAAIWTSKEIGQYEAEETKEGISYSESAMRSGISIAKQRMQKDLVSPAEIMALSALEAYIRFPGKLPVTKIKLKYRERNTNSEPFVARNIIEKNKQDPNDDSRHNDKDQDVQTTLISDDIELDRDTTVCSKQQDNLGIGEEHSM